MGWEDPLEKGMATHSSIPAWTIPWTEEPGGLQSMGSQRVRRDWATKLKWRANWFSNDSVAGKSHYHCCRFSRRVIWLIVLIISSPHVFAQLSQPWTFHVLLFNPNKDHSRSCCGLPFTAEETALARGLDPHLEKGEPDLGSEPGAAPCSCLLRWPLHIAWITLPGFSLGHGIIQTL